MAYTKRFSGGFHLQNNVAIRDPMILPPIDPAVPLKRDDKRARLVFVVGDGFTQGYLASRGAAASIPCRMDDLFPAAPCVEYIPVLHDQLTPGPIWDTSRFPMLLDAWQSASTDAWGFVTHCATTGPINKDLHKAAWSFKTASLEYQLRAYLWHYFRWVNQSLTKIGHDFTKWNWTGPLDFLARNFNLSCVSYNYDFVLEHAISTHGASPLGCPVEGVVRFYNWLPLGGTLVLKPHGSATFGNFSQFLPLEDSANLWLEDVVFDRNAGNDWETTSSPHPLYFPTLPDLVPPGHSYQHLSNPMAETRLAAEMFAKGAQIVVVCGLSGRGPDEPEVSSLLGCLSPQCLRFHVGLDRDRNSPDANGLRAVPDRYYFLHSNEVQNLPQKIDEAWKTHRMPTKTGGAT